MRLRYKNSHKVNSDLVFNYGLFNDTVRSWTVERQMELRWQGDELEEV